MTFTRTISLVLLLVTFAFRKQAQSQSCPCKDATSGAKWNTTDQQTTCVSCEQSPVRVERYCVTQSGENIRCDVDLPCSLKDTCEGKWSPWYNLGACNSSCGPGLQMQSRTCYKKAKNDSRSNNCFDGGLAYVETRLNACRKRCKPTTTPFSTTVRVRTRATSSVEFQPSTNETTIPNSSTLSEKNSFNHSPANSSVLLIAVVSSVAIICIAVIIIVIIVTRKWWSQKPSNTVSTTEDTEVQKSIFYDNDYETISLPPTPNSPTHPLNKKDASDIHLSVENIAYNMEKETKHDHTYTLANDDTYLEPIPTSITEHDDESNEPSIPEGAYISIEDCKIQCAVPKKQTRI